MLMETKGGTKTEMRGDPKLDLKDQSKSCGNCFHKKMCGAFIDATRLHENFNAGWGKSVILPMLPEDLATNCQEYCPIRKNDISK